MKRASLAKTFPGANQQDVAELEANRTELLSTKMAAQYICTFKSFYKAVNVILREDQVF